ncbi:MAG: hypothetical protein U1F65_10560 [Verrucomicrobiota bacterium]
MPKIKIEQLKEGMVVASDVKNIDSMLLVPAGCSLSERQINILSSWGVLEVDVVSAEGCEDADPLSKVSTEELERIRAELLARFWKADEKNPVFMEIFKLALQRRVKSNKGELATA